MQQVLHQLRTGGTPSIGNAIDYPGDDKFGNISLVVPPKPGQKAHQGCTCNGRVCTKAGDGYTPRIYKTHAASGVALEMGHRHVVVLRDARDALWSSYNFKPNVLAVDKAGISVCDFYERAFKCLEPDNYWQFTEVRFEFRHEEQNFRVGGDNVGATTPKCSSSSTRT